VSRHRSTHPDKRRGKPESPQSALATSLLEWAKSQKRSFFWRERRQTPFRILVIEVLLARTRAEAVEPVAARLIRRYPTVQQLAAASVRELEEIVRPLGLFRKRARLLKACAQRILTEHRGRVPRDVDALLSLPSVGRYAATALLCFGFDIPQGVVDANVARVYGRLFSLEKPPARLANAHGLWELANSLVPAMSARRFNWALLDLGASVCLPRSPKCGECPLASRCDFARSSLVDRVRRVEQTGSRSASPL